MRKAATYVLALVVGGGIGLSSAPWASGQERSRRDADREQAEPRLPDGFQLKNLDQIDNIRKELAIVAHDALERRDFGKVVGNLAVENRDRMKDYKDQDFKTYEGVIGQINQNWKQKYGHEFDIKRADNLFTDRYVVVQGIVTNPTVAATNFPVTAERGGEARLAANRERARRDEGQVLEVESQNLKDSHGVAIVRFPEGFGLPSVTASLIEEGRGSWYFAVPNYLTSQQLHIQLQNELTYLGRSFGEWPADENDAYRLVAHRVIMAIYDVNAPEAHVERR